MADFNRVILIGRVTRDPEVRYIASGTAVTDVGLAVNDRRKNPNGEWIEETQFIEVTLWARQAELAGEYLSKGSPVFFEGRLKFDQWEKDGQKHSKLRVVGEKMQFLGSKDSHGKVPSQPPDEEPQYSSASSAPASAVSSGSRSTPPPPPEGDLPF